MLCLKEDNTKQTNKQKKFTDKNFSELIQQFSYQNSICSEQSFSDTVLKNCVKEKLRRKKLNSALVHLCAS